MRDADGMTARRQSTATVIDDVVLSLRKNDERTNERTNDRTGDVQNTFLRGIL